jgi:glycerate kinase
MIILCDVQNKLLGEAGAAAVFGPQKGASPTDVKLLDNGLSVLAAKALQQQGRNIATLDYCGTAGGAAAGMHAFLNAKLVSGIDYFLGLMHFDRMLAKADIVITGEGSLDTQTLHGKAPFGIARRAKKLGLPVIAIAGKIPVMPDNGLSKYFDVLMPIGNEPVELEEALKWTSHNLVRTGKTIGELLNIGYRLVPA